MFVKGNTVAQGKLKSSKNIKKENENNTIPILPCVRKDESYDYNPVKKNATANLQYANVYPELSITGAKKRFIGHSGAI